MSSSPARSGIVCSDVIIEMLHGRPRGGLHHSTGIPVYLGSRRSIDIRGRVEGTSRLLGENVVQQLFIFTRANFWYTLAHASILLIPPIALHELHPFVSVT